MNDGKKNALDEYHWHEALDRASLAVEWFTEFVERHPAVESRPNLRRSAEKVTEQLVDFYQAVANADPYMKIAPRPKPGRK